MVSRARGLFRLTHRQVQGSAVPSMLHDGGGLYLQTTKAGVRSWIYRYTLGEVRHGMGLGPLRALSLAAAREAAGEARKLVAQGIDPILHRTFTDTSSPMPTVAQAIDEYIKGHRSEWSNGKHAAQWQSTLDTYVKPIIGDMPADEVRVGDVLRVLTPIWKKKTETATRVRQRLEAVLDLVYVTHGIDRRNPAHWKGLLDKVLPKPRSVAPVKHFSAMPYRAVPDFMQALKLRPSISARLLEFTILTAARSSMARGARRSEIRGGVWYVPAKRMKARKLFEIPLSEAAQQIVSLIPANGEVIFQSYHGAMSSNATSNLLKLAGHGNVTTHGFRSAFRDWAANETEFAREVIEEAMSHRIKDAAEAAYRRGFALDKRRKLMEAWAAYCYPTSSSEA